MNLNEGYLEDVLLILKDKAMEMTAADRIAIMSFDEMHISHLINFNVKSEKVIEPNKTVQVVFIRGLLSIWQ